MNKKSNLMNHTPVARVLALIVALATVTALVTNAADDKNPASPAPGKPLAMDPATGLPVPPAPSWKDPNWKDPDKVLTDVSYDSLPLLEIARQLRKEFKDAFDVLIPYSWQDPIDPATTHDPQSFSMRMELKNVTASEVFNAMNLVFEGQNMPCRWELILNGKRPTAILRMLPGVSPAAAQPAPTTRLVYFVGDLIGDEKSGGMTMERLVKTVSEVYQMSYGGAKGMIQFHKDAQLLVVTGTADEVRFIQETLAAMRGKVRVDQSKAAQAKKAGEKQ